MFGAGFWGFFPHFLVSVRREMSAHAGEASRLWWGDAPKGTGAEARGC